ncbi:hypothetical protein SAMN05216600_1311 [Pseudomonas cuatrocienegasensis]|uniref:Uncharacterized protein n=1 Tax=Pseudomonas cuatrocienegasensis TaxID=543360 RepID=A0ABY1BRG1_9PSED|nr:MULTISPECIES: hypothetical protein [Pseudomonas]OEC32751.1 hypothetical protein A7D25_22525 [Pseudomonas sp. 21C1]SER45211.1 hypothetical protein SAMN05216600_1311 [Pseudomonas cuatrocienegasensis]
METFNKKAVMETASRLEKLFLKYKSSSSDVAAAYRQCKPLIDRAKDGGIDKATGERLPGGYFSTEFELINIRDLYKAASELDMYLEGWESEEAFNKHMEDILRK